MEKAFTVKALPNGKFVENKDLLNTGKTNKMNASFNSHIRKPTFVCI